MYVCVCVYEFLVNMTNESITSWAVQDYYKTFDAMIANNTEYTVGIWARAHWQLAQSTLSNIINIQIFVYIK